MDKSSPKIVIIGAGMAGLSAAHRLVTSGLRNITILEAADRIGGRIHTIEFGDGKMPVELGASWIHGSGNKNSTFMLADSMNALRPYRIWNRYEDGTYKLSIIVQRYRMSGRFLREDGTEIERETVSAGWNRFQELVDKAQSIVTKGLKNKDRAESNYGTVLTKLLSKQLEENQTAGNRIEDLSRLFNAFRNYTAFHEGDQLERVSYECSDTTCILPGGDIQVPVGYCALLKYLLRFLPVDCIQLNSEVLNLKWLNDSNKVIILLGNGSTLMADHVIVTCSLGVLKHSHATLFSPCLPFEKQKVIESIGFGCVNKILLEYDMPVLISNANNIVFSWNDISISNMETDWVKAIFGFDKIYTKEKVLLGWISGDAASYMETLPDDEIAKTCTRLLRKFLGDPGFPEPTRIVVSRWKSNPYIRGSYSYQTPNLIPNEQNILSRPLTTPSGKPVVLFAGEATHQQNYSCTHGARDSGIREADVLIKLCSENARFSKL